MLIGFVLYCVIQSVYVVQCAVTALNTLSHTQLGFVLFPTRNWACSLTRSCSLLPAYLGLFPSKSLTAFSVWLVLLFWLPRSSFGFTSLHFLPLLLLGQDRGLEIRRLWEVYIYRLCGLFPSTFWLSLLATQTSRLREFFRTKFIDMSDCSSAGLMKQF